MTWMYRRVPAAEQDLPGVGLGIPEAFSFLRRPGDSSVSGRALWR